MTVSLNLSQNKPFLLEADPVRVFITASEKEGVASSLRGQFHRSPAPGVSQSLAHCTSSLKNIRVYEKPYLLAVARTEPDRPCLGFIMGLWLLTVVALEVSAGLLHVAF